MGGLKCMCGVGGWGGRMRGGCACVSVMCGCVAACASPRGGARQRTVCRQVHDAGLQQVVLGLHAAVRVGGDLAPGGRGGAGAGGGVASTRLRSRPRCCVVPSQKGRAGSWPGMAERSLDRRTAGRPHHHHHPRCRHRRHPAMHAGAGRPTCDTSSALDVRSARILEPFMSTMKEALTVALWCGRSTAPMPLVLRMARQMRMSRKPVCVCGCGGGG